MSNYREGSTSISPKRKKNGVKSRGTVPLFSQKEKLHEKGEGGRWKGGGLKIRAVRGRHREPNFQVLEGGVEEADTIRGPIEEKTGGKNGQLHMGKAAKDRGQSGEKTDHTFTNWGVWDEGPGKSVGGEFRHASLKCTPWTTKQV